MPEYSQSDEDSDVSQNMEAGYSSQEEEEEYSRWVAEKEDAEQEELIRQEEERELRKKLNRGNR